VVEEGSEAPVLTLTLDGSRKLMDLWVRWVIGNLNNCMRGVSVGLPGAGLLRLRWSFETAAEVED